jgi:hypothetical protein
MSVLRSTNNHYQQGTAIDLDVSHLTQGALELLYSWLEIWLFRHCKAGWAIQISKDDIFTRPRKATLTIYFDDVREAVYFKLSPEYLKVHA